MERIRGGRIDREIEIGGYCGIEEVRAIFDWVSDGEMGRIKVDG